MITLLGGIGLTVISIATIFLLKEKLKNETREEKISRIKFIVLGELLLILSAVVFCLLFNSIDIPPNETERALQLVRSLIIPVIIIFQLYGIGIIGLSCFYMKNGKKDRNLNK